MDVARKRDFASGYKTYDETQDCYLDGRYFDVVFKSNPLFARKPLSIQVIKRLDDDGSVDVKITASESDLFTGAPIRLGKVSLKLIKVLPRSTPQITRHASLAIVTKQTLYHFDPTTDQELRELSTRVLEDAAKLQNLKYSPIPITFTPEQGGEQCLVSGYCVAYIIKYAADLFLNERERGEGGVDVSDIKRFAQWVKEHYQDQLPDSPPEEEYGRRGYGRGYGGFGRGYGGFGAGLAGGLAMGALTGAALSQPYYAYPSYPYAYSYPAPVSY